MISPRTRVRLASGATLLALLVQFGGLTAATSADAAPAPTHPVHTRLHGAPPPMLGGKQVQLTDVSATGPDDIWATGVPLGLDPLVMHWNGTRWSTTVLGGGQTGLDAIDALSPTNVWAAGFDFTARGAALIEHWDGTSWTHVPTPTEPDDTFELLDIGFVSPDDGYAFGAIGSGFRTAGAHAFSRGGRAGGPAWDAYVTLHWNGTSWTQIETDGNEFESLSASSPTDAWMVGRATDGTTITQHWDGSTWTVVPSPSLGTDNDLSAVKDISPDDVWAAGNGYEKGTYALHWNGTKWKLIRDAAQAPADTFGIDGTSPQDVWMTGDQAATQGLIEHWDGHAWALVDTDTSGLQQPQIESVVALSPTDAWAVGAYYIQHRHSFRIHHLILHWDGTAWSRYQP